MIGNGIAARLMNGLPHGRRSAVPSRATVSPLVYDADRLARASRIAVFVPGAFASIDIFAAAAFWQDAGFGLVHYRFPGYDGLAADHALDIADAGAAIAEFVQDWPRRDVTLVGYSTGGPIVLMAAAALRRAGWQGRLSVALISPAVDRAGGFQTRARGTADVIRAALRARSLRVAPVWRAYWQVLLFGRGNVSDPAFADRIAAFSGPHRPDSSLPTPHLAALHTRALRRWRLPRDFALGDTPVGLFRGTDDPVFSTRQTARFAARCGAREIVSYDHDGHMPFLTQSRLFHDVLAFAQGAQSDAAERASG